MPVIYQPTGKAREYSPLACNLYMACSHKCRYCYAPHVLQRNADTYFRIPHPRKDVLKNIEAELKANVPTKQVMLSFIGDVYCETHDNNATTRAALELFLEYGAPVAVLTKGGERCLKDIDLFKKFGKRIWVGATLTFMDEAKSRYHESGASLPQERLDVLAELKRNGVTTFASFEPMIEARESLAVLQKTLEMDNVDSYKIGKTDNSQWLTEPVDWDAYLREGLSLIRPTGKGLYVKHNLRTAATNVEVRDSEKDADAHGVQA